MKSIFGRIFLLGFLFLFLRVEGVSADSCACAGTSYYCYTCSYCCGGPSGWACAHCDFACNKYDSGTCETVPWCGEYTHWENNSSNCGGGPSCTGCSCTPSSCSGDYPLTSCPSGSSCESTTHTCTKLDSCGNS
ncbi:MAG: hypothetical protein PHP96_02995, partial [Candidatus Dojkabacteria bacterium]|nr:hypothetical protein [Candidatus Dojkabacteria bacterium]